MFRRESVEGLNKLMKDIKKLEKLPQSQITKGTRKGANVLLKASKAKAPKRTGKLKRNMVLRPEKTRKRGKKVFQITFQKVEKFPDAVKVTKDGTRYYYPSSQNFGFKTIDGGRVEGKHFLDSAIKSKGNEAAKTIVDEIGKEIDKSLSEGRIR